jgi:two-component system, OmpR family, phosphate regulon sensor histidine kinase PhoR
MWIPVLIVFGCVASTAAALLAVRARPLSVRLRDRDAISSQGLDAASSQKSLAAISREYDALLAHCGGGVLLVGATDIIERANATACSLLGITTSSMVGKPALQGTLSTELCALVVAARERRALQHGEICAPASSTGQLVVTASPVEGDSDGCRILLVVHDVTELRRLETVRRDFVANVSHELRTPLTSIRAMAETLQDGAMKDTSVACHFLKTIIDETVRLTRISEDLLHLSQAESQSPERSRFDLTVLCEEVAGRLEMQAHGAGIRLSWDVPARLEVNANRDQMEQVLVNLLDNAIKYTPSGGEVRLTASKTPDGAVVRISDSGIGLRAEDVPRIFERFYRVDKARSRQSGGTGLGLSIVKHIVEAHGGQVRVESDFGRGSAFSFTVRDG